MGDFNELKDEFKLKLIPHYVEADSLGLHFFRSQLMADFVKKDDPNER